MEISFKSEDERKKEEEINRRIRHNRTHRFVYNPVNISTIHEWMGTLAMSCEKYVRMRAEFDGHPHKNTIWVNLTVMAKERHINTLEGFLEFMEGECPSIEVLATDRGYDSEGFLKRYLVIDAECRKSPNEYGDGYAWAVASVMYVSNGTRRWLTIREFLGEPAYYVTENPVMDALADADSKELDMLNLQPLKDFDGIALGDYRKTLEDVEGKPENAAGSLVAYAIALTRCRKEDEGYFISLGKNRCSDKIPIFGAEPEDDDGFGSDDVPE